jgi:hypothetical protein
LKFEVDSRHDLRIALWRLHHIHVPHGMQVLVPAPYEHLDLVAAPVGVVSAVEADRSPTKWIRKRTASGRLVPLDLGNHAIAGRAVCRFVVPARADLDVDVVPRAGVRALELDFVGPGRGILHCGAGISGAEEGLDLGARSRREFVGRD